MEKRTIIGVDISKMTLDNACSLTKTHLKIANTPAGFNRWLKWALQLAAPSRLWVLMEHTGHYSYQFELFLQQAGIPYSKVPAIEIKRSGGLLRGKSDKADAHMISEYGQLRQELLKEQTAPVKELTALKDLLSLRSKLVADRSGYKCRLKEMQATRRYAIDSIQVQIHQHQIATLSSDIKAIEKEIRQQIGQDKKLLNNYHLLLPLRE